MLLRSFKTLPLATLLSSVPLAAAHAVILINLYNTGVDAGGSALAGGNGANDPHYTVTATTIPGVVIGDLAKTYLNGAYVADSSSSRRVPDSGSPFNGNGAFSISFTFDLTGYDPTTAAVSGLWGVDNDGEIFINGVSTGNTLLESSVNNFNQLHAYSINTGFVAGLNTLTVAVADSGSPAAARIDGIFGSANLFRRFPSPPHGR